jgi:hypothetical protein
MYGGPPALREELKQYAHIYAQTLGLMVDLASLVPHMLETFMARDRGFQRLRSARVPTSDHRPT